MGDSLVWSETIQAFTSTVPPAVETGHTFLGDSRHNSHEELDLTEAVTHIVTQHVIVTADPVELRGSIVDEHAALARLIASGDAERVEDEMASHFRRQHDYVRERSPARLQENIQWR
jgi:DNA-binding FadR family transcriptional regulator